ncbi:hypothetical protein [Sporosarcina quadrami]|uniref:hypothetical protein n=1 Tax=Sporosarcina quadrami TaxID=2762234 RepID=UPI00296B0F1B|nr:hypothetical protein [Sporosarcina quadrami]
MGESNRKVRSDKKKEVKPTISIQLKDTIYRISYITNSPVKDVAESLCIHGMASKKVLDVLSWNLRRTIRLDNTMYIGDIARSSLQRMGPVGECERISVRFKQIDFENLSTLAFGLSVTPSRATALLLDASIRDRDFINSYFEGYLNKQLDDRRMAELKSVLKYLNENNPYEEEISWGMLLSYIVEEIKDSASTVTESISAYIKKWK